MKQWSGDVAILGSGFGGSLLAQILRGLGLETLLVDRSRHPRFMIGESSTPVADFLWAKLTDQYGLPHLRPLAEYGSWQRTYPQIPCGLKRGFSYFGHEPQQPFAVTADHRHETLVASSFGIDDADTHWLRADFDALIAASAVAAGVPLWEATQITEIQHSASGWELQGQGPEGPVQIRAGFLIDGTGEAQALRKVLSLHNHVDEMQTRSRAVLAHFRNLKSWSATLEHPPSFSEHPYPCDNAALHHFVPEGWMYVLPFNNGVTSAGWSLNMDRAPTLPDETPTQEFQRWLDRYPSIADQFAGAEICPVPGMIRTGRLQRWLSPAAGADWALLPTAAVFLDPLHSTGNAHTLSGIERLADIFARFGRNWRDSEAQAALARYDQGIQQEAWLLDRLIAGCFQAMDRFPVLSGYTMLYFTAAIWSEHERRHGKWQLGDAFLLANRPWFCEIVDQTYHDVCQLTQRPRNSADEAALLTRLRNRIAPYNLGDLLNPECYNLYPYPAACAAPELAGE